MLSAIPPQNHALYGLHTDTLSSNKNSSNVASEGFTPITYLSLQKQFDPSQQLCQYESGGGSCRDSQCKDLHFSDFKFSGKPCRCSNLFYSPWLVSRWLLDVNFFASFSILQVKYLDFGRLLFYFSPWWHINYEWRNIGAQLVNIKALQVPAPRQCSLELAKQDIA